MYRLIMALVMLSCANLVSAADSYLCVANKATGFQFNPESGEWGHVEFIPRARYVVKQATDSEAVYSTKEGYAWTVTDSSGGDPNMGCKMDFESAGGLYCEGFVGDIFRMNNKSMRYVFTYVGSYIESSLDFSNRENIKNGSDRGGDTPTVEIGKCSRP